MTNDTNLRQTPDADSAAGGQVQALYEEEDGISILDLLLILARRKWLILGLTFLGGVIATIIAFLVPPTYTATAVIMPPQQQSSMAAAMLSQLGGAAGLASQSLGIKNPSDPYIGILSSRTVADELIAQFNLQKVYQTAKLTNTRKALSGKTKFNSAKYSLIQISVEDRDPERAADLANAYVDKLQAQNSRLAITEASQRRLFFEKQLEAEKDSLANAEAELKKTQEQKGIFQVSSQVQVVIASMAQMRAEVTAREVNLERLKAGATTNNPEVLRQEIELKALRSKLGELEASSSQKRSGDPFLPTSMVPEAGLEYARRLREVKYHETLFEILAKQYEAARIDEAKQAPIIQIVDRAIAPDVKSAPARAIYLMMGVLLGGVFGIVAAVFKNAVQNPQNAGKIANLKTSLFLRPK